MKNDAPARELAHDVPKAEYVELAAPYFLAFLIIGLIICALSIGTNEFTVLAVALGLSVGSIGYCLNRLVLGKRLFFKRENWPIGRALTVGFTLAFLACNMFFPQLMSNVYDLIWVGLAFGTFYVLLALEGLIRTNWKTNEKRVGRFGSIEQ